MFDAQLVVEATAVATHPDNVVLDSNGHPVLDDFDQPVLRDE